MSFMDCPLKTQRDRQLRVILWSPRGKMRVATGKVWEERVSFSKMTL